MSEEKKESSVLTGVWRREGKNGVYFSATVTKEEILNLLGRVEGEYVSVTANPVVNKTKDTQPDLLISLRKGMSPAEREAYRKSKET